MPFVTLSPFCPSYSYPWTSLLPLMLIYWVRAVWSSAKIFWDRMLSCQDVEFSVLKQRNPWRTGVSWHWPWGLPCARCWVFAVHKVDPSHVIYFPVWGQKKHSDNISARTMNTTGCERKWWRRQEDFCFAWPNMAFCLGDIWVGCWRMCRSETQGSSGENHRKVLSPEHAGRRPVCPEQAGQWRDLRATAKSVSICGVS